MRLGGFVQATNRVFIAIAHEDDVRPGDEVIKLCNHADAQIWHHIVAATDGADAVVEGFADLGVVDFEIVPLGDKARGQFR